MSNSENDRKHEVAEADDSLLVAGPARPSGVPRLSLDENGTWAIGVKNHGDLGEFFGDTNDAFGTVIVQQVYKSGGMTEHTFDREGAAMEIVGALAPRDAFESLLIAQMAATHVAIMRHSTKMAEAVHVEMLDLHERIVTKLSRTFTAQSEALRKHRNGGKQTVTVQHVNVQDGGQAIVGNVQQGEGKP